jgi:hypothetical protein
MCRSLHISAPSRVHEEVKIFQCAPLVYVLCLFVFSYVQEAELSRLLMCLIISFS